METTNLLEMQIDDETSAFLAEAAKWAKFLAIMGFIGCGFMLFAGLIMNFMTLPGSEMEALGGGYNASATMYGRGFAAVFYVVLSLVYVAPCIFLYKFATRMQEALKLTDQGVLNSSFSNLKSLFKFMGILTIIMLAFTVLAVVFAVVAVSTMAG